MYLRSKLVNRILFFIFLMSKSAITNAQNTTQEEFNFMNNGYRTMVESGLDMKKGYVLLEPMNFQVSAGGNNYNIKYFSLIREGNNSLAGTISVVSSLSWKRNYYLGIPAATEDGHIDLANSTMAQITSFGWDTNIRTAFLQSLAEYLSVQMTRRYLTDNNKVKKLQTNKEEHIRIRSGLSGRRISSLPTFIEKYTENTKVAVDIEVDGKGKVSKAKINSSGTTTTNSSLREDAIVKAMQVKFNESSELTQNGTIVISFN